MKFIACENYKAENFHVQLTFELEDKIFGIVHHRKSQSRYIVTIDPHDFAIKKVKSHYKNIHFMGPFASNAVTVHSGHIFCLNLDPFAVYKGTLAEGEFHWEEVRTRGPGQFPTSGTLAFSGPNAFGLIHAQSEVAFSVLKLDLTTLIWSRDEINVDEASGKTLMTLAAKEDTDVVVIGQQAYVMNDYHTDMIIVELQEEAEPPCSFFDTECLQLLTRAPTTTKFVYKDELYAFGGKKGSPTLYKLQNLDWIKVHTFHNSVLPVYYNAVIVKDTRVFLLGPRCKKPEFCADLSVLSMEDTKLESLFDLCIESLKCSSFDGFEELQPTVLAEYFRDRSLDEQPAMTDDEREDERVLHESLRKETAEKNLIETFFPSFSHALALSWS